MLLSSTEWRILDTWRFMCGHRLAIVSLAAALAAAPLAVPHDDQSNVPLRCGVLVSLPGNHALVGCSPKG